MVVSFIRLFAHQHQAFHLQNLFIRPQSERDGLASGLRIVPRDGLSRSGELELTAVPQCLAYLANQLHLSIRRQQKDQTPSHDTVKGAAKEIGVLDRRAFCQSLGKWARKAAIIFAEASTPYRSNPCSSA
jgi:hypothetical protein